MPYSAFAKQYVADQDTALQLLSFDQDKDTSLAEFQERLITLDGIMGKYKDNRFALLSFEPLYKKLQQALCEKNLALQQQLFRRQREEAVSDKRIKENRMKVGIERHVADNVVSLFSSHQQSSFSNNRTTINTIISNPTQMLLQYYQQQGIISEEKNCILQTLCLVRGLHVGIEGYSGSGKTKLADALLALVPKKIVYRAELQSPTALWYDAERVNNAAVLYIPELQKAYSSARSGTPMVSEIIKNLTEGRKITRRVTMPDKSIEEISLHHGATIFYTLALENSFKKDDETTRRFICLQTDDSLEHRERVKAEKANTRFCADNHDNNSVLTMQQYISSLIDERKQWKIKDPYAVSMHTVIPATLRGASFAEHYFNLVEAHAYFHRYQRVADEKNKCMFTSIADHLRIQEYYLPQLFTSLQGMDTNTADKHLLAEAKKISEEQQPLPFMVAEAAKRMQDSYPLLAPSWENYEQQKIFLLEKEAVFP